MIGVDQRQVVDLARYGWARDLLLPLSAIRDHALEEFDATQRPAGVGAPEARLNLLLLLSAAEQVVADHLARGGLDLSPVRRTLKHRRVATAALDAAEGAADAMCSMRSSISGRNTARRLRLLRETGLRIGTALVEEDGEFPIVRSDLEEAFADLEPGLAQRRMKIPSCFRAQDITPADCFELARRFAAAVPAATDVLVVGVRTSGSYMAPLVAGWLNAHGHAARYLTVRPKAPLVALERRAMLRPTPGAVLVVDDPPMTGSSFVKTARLVEASGLQRAAITFLVPLGLENALGEEERRLFDRYQRVELPTAELAVRKQLTSPELMAFVAAGADPSTVKPLLSAAEVEAQSRRRHVKQIYEVRDAGRVHVKGVGLGWFGYPARHAAAALGKRVPETIGFWGTLMATREQVPAAAAPTIVDVADYVAERSRALQLPAREAEMEFLKDGYYRLAKLLARVHGPLAPFGIGPVRRTLVSAAAGAPACLIDGRMGLDEWLGGSPAAKRDFEEHAFDKDDLGLYDPAYDLAGALLERGPDREAERELVDRYTKAGGDPDVGRRLSLALLLYGAFLMERRSWEVEGDRGTPRWSASVQAWLEAESGLTWTVDRLLAEAFPAAAPASASALWSIDVDGVLEDAGLGFPATTPAAALALQEARRAGAAVILNSGRSLPELVLRCDALNLDGAVAEYGSVIWSATTGLSESLLEPPESECLDQVRRAARDLSGVHLDARYQNSVRLRRFTGSRAVALTAEQIEHLTSAGRGEVVPIQGARQTDFISRRRSKGDGLARFCAWTHLTSSVFAVGDSEPDAEVARRVTRAYAPLHRDDALAGIAVHLKADRQRAVLEAVRREHGLAATRAAAQKSAADAALVRLLALRDSPRAVRALRAFSPGLLQVFRT